MTIQDLESQYTSGLYTKRPIAIVRGSGAHLWDSDENEYIDCVGGQGAGNLGHANPAVTAAIVAQAQTLISCPEMFYNDRRAELIQKLIGIAPKGIQRAYLCSSGTEAVEACLKFARIATGRKEVVATMRGFHGRTIGALSATWEKKYREPFEPLWPGFKHVAYNDLAALEAAVTDQTAGVILEVVQGEGGVRPGTLEFLRGAQKLCRERGAMLIVDEVQTGFGRTGKMFACEHYGLEPDLMALAKSIAGGLPMGAALIGERVGQLPPQVHGSTFGGNPLACAASLAAIEYLQANRLPERVAEMGDWWIGELKRIESPLIREVRGLGLMVGIELKQKVTPFLQALMAKGVLALPAGLTVLRFLPPLVIEEADLVRVVEAVREVLAEPVKAGVVEE
ncbi:MAG: aspartate aminotransferase family protein [Chloroflexi bacterium]|nr:aspartate aminotransferase family protein [Chloroflexota bacterium]